MELIDGKKIAAQVKQELADEVARMKAAGKKNASFGGSIGGKRSCQRNLCRQ